MTQKSGRHRAGKKKHGKRRRCAIVVALWRSHLDLRAVDWGKMVCVCRHDKWEFYSQLSHRMSWIFGFLVEVTKTVSHFSGINLCVLGLLTTNWNINFGQMSQSDWEQSQFAKHCLGCSPKAFPLLVDST